MTGIGDQQLRQRAVGNFALDQRRHGTFGRDFIEVVMTIETRTGQGNEQLARLDGATVDADAVEARIRSDHARIQRAGQFA